MIARPNATGSDPWLVVRADARAGRGVGHVARTLALAEAWTRGRGRVTLITEALPPPWGDRWSRTGAEVLPPGSLPAGTPDWWVVDGYDLDPPEPGTARFVARVDDHGRSPSEPVDLVVDQNLGATAGPYAGRAHTVLVGSRYAMLRRSVVDAAAEPHVEGADIVVTLGGAPVPAVRRFGDAVVAALLDGGYRARLLDGSIDTATVLPGAPVVISAAGSTCWELALFGRPAVLVAVSDDQEPVGAELGRRGAAVYLGRIEALDPAEVAGSAAAVVDDPDQRTTLGRAIGSVVDGRGAARVNSCLRAALLDLTPVTDQDIGEVFRLNNDPLTRANSFVTDPIPWEDHVAWFARSLADDTRWIYLARDGTGAVVGLVRFGLDDERGSAAGRGGEVAAEIGVVAAPERRGQGWGPALIDAGTRRVLADAAGRRVTRVEAQVKATNEASARSFLDADFEPVPSEDPEVLRYARPDGTGRHG